MPKGTNGIKTVLTLSLVGLNAPTPGCADSCPISVLKCLGRVKVVSTKQ